MEDAGMLFSDAQEITATAASTSHYDAGGAVNMGSGQPLHIDVTVSGVTSSSPTMIAALQADDVDTFDGAGLITVVDTGAAATVANGNRFMLAIPPHAPRRYFRLYYTAGGSNPHYHVTSHVRLDRNTAPATL